MHISRIVIRNFHNFRHLDVTLRPGVTCLVGENNTGKTNLLRAIRLAIDANLSSQYRRLLEHDIHSGADLSKPLQVVVSLEFTDYKDSVNGTALMQGCEVSEDIARIHYRFRPRRDIIEDIEAEEMDGSGLSITEDYHFQITGGGEKDPATVSWNENLGQSLRFEHLQAFLVEALPALRDVGQSLRNSYESPLGRILNATDIGEEDKKALVKIMQQANASIESQSTFSETSDAIKKAFSAASGEAFGMGIKLGMADPSFASISRSLKVLLSNNRLEDFEVVRNGLGLNNILYISMLLEYFERRSASTRSAGQLLLIEEPEAHLHPQLQRVLYTTLASKPFQSILSTHSTHISSLAPFESFITLSDDAAKETKACNPILTAKLSEKEAGDLDRYLDATRSTLLYARKVLLVEGPAELFLIPVLVKKIMGIDLDRHGITVVPIYGTHFGSYAKLFGPDALPKKCVILCDGDMPPEELGDGMDEDEALVNFTIDVEENDFLQVYQCPVTFERALTLKGTLPMFLKAVEECEYPQSVTKIRDAIEALDEEEIDSDDEKKILDKMRQVVLAAAKRYSKARFAQIASKYVSEATEIPSYIEAAVDWLVEE